MSTGSLSPAPLFYAWNTGTGAPLAGGLVNTYVAGTTIPAVTWTNVSLTVPNANPVVLNSAGYGVIYLQPGLSYKYVVTDANGVPQYTRDNISAVPGSAAAVDITGTAGENLLSGNALVYLSDGSGGKNAGQWYYGDSTNSYSSSGAILVGMLVNAIAQSGTGTIRLSGEVPVLGGLVVGTSYYVDSSPGGITSTKPINARFVGVANGANSILIAPNPPPTLPIVQTITATGAQNDFALSPGCRVLRCNNATLATFTGFLAGYDGQRLTIESVGAGQVDFAHQNTGSTTAADRLINNATSGNTSLSAGVGTAAYVYDGTTARWRLVAHNQGAWIDVPFSAGNFSAVSAMTWTVAVGMIQVNRYVLNGRSLTWDLGVTGSTIAGTPATYLLAIIPGGFTTSGLATTPGFAVIGNNGGALAGGAWNTPGTTLRVAFYVNPTLTTNWTASAANASVYALMSSIEVT